MAIGTATAIIGSAIIGAGASALSSRSAANKAADAANYAADKNAEVSREIYNQTRTDLAPYNTAGQGALSALMTRLGLTPVSAGAAPGPRSAPTISGPAPPARAAGQPAPPAYGPQGDPTKFNGGFNDTGPVPGWNPTGALDPGKDAAREAGGAPTAPTSAAVPTASWADYGAQNPDILDAYKAYQSGAEARPGETFQDWGYAPGLTEEQFLQRQYEIAGKNEGRTGAPATTGPEYASEDFGTRPDALSVPTFVRPQDTAAPTFERPDGMNAPSWGDFFGADFTQDPSYQFRLNESLKGVNANFAGRGLLRGGDTAKALLARGGQEASQEYGNQFQRALSLFDRANDNYRYGQNRQDANFSQDRAFDTDAYRYGQDRTDRNFIDDRSYGTNLWNTQQNRQDSIFSEDRGFNANRYDVGTDNLFRLVSGGQSAAGAGATAGNAYASNIINSNNQRATTTANAAIANAANTTNLFGSAANAIGTYYGSRQPTAPLPRTYSI